MKEPKKSSSSPSINDLRPGDIVKIYAPQAGYPKYHLCLCTLSADGAAQFIFMNSKVSGYEGDFAVPNEEVPCLAPSDTGFTVFSLSQIPRYNAHQMELYEAEVLGRISAALAGRLLEEVRKTPVLTARDRRTAEAALEFVIEEGG